MEAKRAAVYLRCQREILQLLAEGKSMKEIASVLNLTPRIVAFHKYRIMEVLHVHTNAELVQYALKIRGDRGPEGGDAAGIAVRKPRSPSLNSGSAAAKLDDGFDDSEGIGYGEVPPTRSRSRGELPPTRPQ